MIKLSLKIYLLANLAIVLFALAMSLPYLAGWDIILYISGVSLLFSLPVIPALLLVFWIAGRLQQNIFFKWILFLLLIAIYATLPAFMMEFPRMAFCVPLLQFSVPAAFLGVLFQALPIHQYLINSYGKENPETI